MRRDWRDRNPLKYAWERYRGNAKTRGREFDLPRRLFEDLLTDNCFYCGHAPDPINSIDRVDNDGGYVEDNVVTACNFCNQAKHTHTRAEFEEWAKRVAARL